MRQGIEWRGLCLSGGGERLTLEVTCRRKEVSSGRGVGGPSEKGDSDRECMEELIVAVDVGEKSATREKKKKKESTKPGAEWENREGFTKVRVFGSVGQGKTSIYGDETRGGVLCSREGDCGNGITHQTGG